MHECLHAPKRLYVFFADGAPHHTPYNAQPLLFFLPSQASKGLDTINAHSVTGETSAICLETVLVMTRKNQSHTAPKEATHATNQPNPTAELL